MGNVLLRWPLDKKNPSKGKWVVDAKGGPNDYFEISVIREGNEHGKTSYG